MKKIFIVLLSLFFLACGEKYPYTSTAKKKKMIRTWIEPMFDMKGEELEANIAKVDEKILTIIRDLQILADNGDEKAEKEIEEWESRILTMKRYLTKR